MTAHGRPWPDRRQAAVSITFDNLGEAAELELGLRPDDQPLGGHYSVTTALPIVLEELANAGLPATFFVEGLNAEIYPEALEGIADAGHEVAYHAWRHENWSLLEPGEEEANLARGLEAMRAIDLNPAGFRPPGGLLSESTLALLRDRDLSYCSPAGTGAGIDTVVVLPFAWPAVDAFHVLPTFAFLRQHVTGSQEAGGPDAARDSLLAAIDDAVALGGQTTLVLHTWMVELERDAVREVLSRVSADVARGELWAARCDETARWIASRPTDFADPPQIDRTSWMEPGPGTSRLDFQ
jgi:peptidoglycan/xylan/chitin deacetylase (PgdA/CDA1 family)